MKSKILFTLIFAASLTLSAFTQTVPIKHLQGLGDTRYHEVKYKPLDQTYHIYVRLPEDYDAKKKYPTAYLLDGGGTFPLLGSYYRSLNFSGEAPEMIIVGISYGSNDWGGLNQRSRDFTAPADSRAEYGGARKFSEFFRTTLFPLIEREYASDSSKRIVFGQSLGGQYALYAAQFETGLFWGHVASNPALHRNLDLFIKQEPLDDKKIRLYVSSGSLDNPRFLVPANKWVEHWNAREGVGWSLKTEILEGQTHMSAAPEAFRRGLKWIFGE
ncbi:MAG: alpha/beta hydrolase-fold protein [Acidobacteriota bacterium]|nr:alpha/beta hydrolase-fold protein [Acidobacteriota bacterium]